MLLYLILLIVLAYLSLSVERQVVAQGNRNDFAPQGADETSPEIYFWDQCADTAAKVP
jgi:hypothetical protein